MTLFIMKLYYNIKHTLKLIKIHNIYLNKFLNKSKLNNDRNSNLINPYWINV